MNFGFWSQGLGRVRFEDVSLERASLAEYFSRLAISGGFSPDEESRLRVMANAMALELLQRCKQSLEMEMANKVRNFQIDFDAKAAEYGIIGGNYMYIAAWAQEVGWVHLDRDVPVNMTSLVEYFTGLVEGPLSLDEESRLRVMANAMALHILGRYPECVRSAEELRDFYY
jgi:hypothetical protein